MFMMVGTSTFISFVIVLLSLNSIAFGFFYQPSYVEMTPDDPIVIEFDTIVLNCTLMPRYNGTCGVRDLFVRHNGTDFKYPDIRAITDKTAQFRLPNATVGNNGRFSCELPPTCNINVGFWNAQYVHVRKDPLMPYLIGCTVDNWEYLVCSWGPNASVQSEHMSSLLRDVKQQLLWQHPGDGDNWTGCPEIPSKHSEQCFWRSSSFTMKKEYCIKIVVWSAKTSNVSSVVECHNPELIVKPKPPAINQTTSNGNGRMLSIEWCAPSTVEKVSLIYHVVVHSKWEVRNFTVVNDTRINVSTVPNTEYSVSIVAFPAEGGFSSGGASTTVLSESAAPSENPFVMTNFYSVNIADRTLVLYWQPISEKNYCGPEFQYYVINRTLSSSSENPVCDSSSCYSTVMTWNGFASDLLIGSKNKIGSAEQPSLAIHVPSNDQLLFDIEVVAEGQDKNVSIDWFVKEASFDRGVESVMLFWCQHLNFYQTCKAPIQWQTINNTSQRDINLTLDDEYKNFQFGASVKFSGGDYSGIQWSRSRYSLTKMPDAPEGLKVSAPPGKHSELQVSWKEPHYSDFSACIRAFTIFYCPVNHRNQCLSESQSVVIFKYRDHRRISGDDDGSFVLKGLDPYATYKVWMMSNSRQGSSKPSESVYGGTHQPWFTPGKIVGIVAGVLLASMVVIFGLYVTFRCCDKYCKKLTSGFKVSLPQRRFQLSSTSSDVPVLNKDPTEVQYWRQPSQVSTGSHDSGHYSFPPSSPAMMPLLLEGSDKLKDQDKRGRNCYQPTNLTGIETIEDDEGSDGSALDITTYKIVPNVPVGIDTKPQVNQTQYILPEEIHWMEGGTLPVNAGDCLASDTKDSKVDYCNDFHFPNASDFSDIGYTKIEQIPTTVVSIPSNQPEPCERSATDNRNEDSNLLFCLDRQPGELNRSSTQSVPLVNHLDELLATLSEGQSLTDDILVGTEALSVDDSCPIGAMKTTKEELPLYSKQALSSVELNFLDPIIIQGTGFQSGNNGYLPHNLLLSID